MSAPFKLGRVVATRAVADAIDPAALAVILERHRSCDWGDVCADDRALNDLGLIEGEEDRLHSIHKVGDRKVWIITEWDRSATTLLFPEDY